MVESSLKDPAVDRERAGSPGRSPRESPALRLPRAERGTHTDPDIRKPTGDPYPPASGPGYADTCLSCGEDFMGRRKECKNFFRLLLMQRYYGTKVTKQT